MASYAQSEAFVLNQQPFIALMQQQKQQKAAQEQALNQRIENDLSKINFKGVRDVDMDNILNQYSRIKDMGIAYRDAIRNPAKNPKAIQQYRDAWQKIQADVAKSQDAKERTKAFYSFYGQNRDKIDPTSFNTLVADINSPIDTPNYLRAKDKNVNDLIFNDAQFDNAKWTNAMLAAAPGKEITTPIRLPNGQYRNNKVFQRDPKALGSAAALAYDANYQGAEKFFNKQFASLDPEDKATYEQYVQQYDPTFEIKTPKDLAVATTLFGKVNQDQGYTISGQDQAFAMAQQRRAQAFARQQAATQEANIRSRPDKRKQDDYFLVNDIAKDLSAGNGQRAVEPFLSYASPGTVVTYLQSGKNDAGQLERIYKDLKQGGIDAKTRLMSKQAFNNGVIVVGVPKINPVTKTAIPGQYDYMAVSKSEKNPQTRINALLNYAKGGVAKPLKESFFKSRPEETTNELVLPPGSLDDIDENEQ